MSGCKVMAAREYIKRDNKTLKILESEWERQEGITGQEKYGTRKRGNEKK